LKASRPGDQKGAKILDSARVNTLKEMRKTIVAQKQLIGALESDMALLLDELRRLKARQVKEIRAPVLHLIKKPPEST